LLCCPPFETQPCGPLLRVRLLRKLASWPEDIVWVCVRPYHFAATGARHEAAGATSARRGDEMKRRALAGFLALAPFAMPTDGRAQQGGRRFRLAVLTRPGQDTDLTPGKQLPYWLAWRDELRRLGYVEGRNLVIERRSIAEEMSRDELARLVDGLAPDVIFAPAQNIAAKAAGLRVPVVTSALDPVGAGLAESLARPGGNVTGLSLDAGLEGAKRFGLLKDVAPAASRIAVLALRQYWEGKASAPIRDAAPQAGLSPVGAPLDPPMDEAGYRRVFAEMARNGVDAVYVSPSIENLAHARLVAELAVAAKWPTLCFWRDNVEAGGLMSYSVDIVEIWRRAAQYIDRLMNGATAATLPFEQPTRFELVLNLRTARALGLTIPPLVLARADEVIE